MAKKIASLTRQKADPDGVVRPEEAHLYAEHTNPWPEPEELERLHALYPDAVKRVFDYTEQEQRFRHDLTHKQDLRKFKSTVIGMCAGIFAMVLGFFILAGGLAGAVWLMLEGHEWKGVSLFVTVVLIAAGMFFAPANRKKQPTPQPEPDPQPRRAPKRK